MLWFFINFSTILPCQLNNTGEFFPSYLCYWMEKRNEWLRTRKDIKTFFGESCVCLTQLLVIVGAELREMLIPTLQSLWMTFTKGFWKLWCWILLWNFKKLFNKFQRRFSTFFSTIFGFKIAIYLFVSFLLSLEWKFPDLNLIWRNLLNIPP
jgi:hypothetical protein